MPGDPQSAASGPGPQRPATPPGGIRRPGPAGPVPPGGRPPAGGPGGPRRPGGPGPERRPGEEPTDLLPPVQPIAEREPQLLTHREPDEEVVEAYYDDEDEYDDEELTEEEERALRRKKIWRRVRRVSYVVLGLMVLSPLVAFAIAYQIVDVPIPEEVAAKQGKAITLLYSDGSEMTKIAPQGSNRTLVKYEEIPDTVKNAVFAAEDPTFMTNPGFDVKAIARAAWYQVTDRESGGSGLTQQYIKKATEEEDQTLSRKFTEIVKAYKMSKQQDKPAILTAYLNTIYFGRSAYGIKAAAEMYFGKTDLNQLTQSEAALLAGMIQNPSRDYDDAYTQERWEYVMGQLVEHKMIDQADKDSQTFPAMKPFAETQQLGLEGPLAHVQNQVELEMAKMKVPRNVAQKRGAIVHTTIDPPMQKAADEAVNEIMANQPEELKYSLTAIDPRTGAVRAYWAGKDGNGIDYATGTIQEAGSSFKPFDLVAALKMGKGLGSTYDGTSPRTFPGLKDPIRNATDPTNSCGKQCPIRDAMRLSLNTVFYDMVLNDTGAQAVADAAHQAGIPDKVTIEGKERQLLVGEGGGTPNVGIALGGDDAQVRPFDMASAYATFAARGVYRAPFFITKITDAEGDLIAQHTVAEKPAFDPDPQKSQDIADNVTDALKAIPQSSNIGCAGGRQCAGKTGTHELPGNASQNSKAWMVGYTPSLSAAVWMGRNEGNVALQDARGNAIFGSGLPGKIWQKFMDKALANTPKETFPKAKPMGQYENPKKVTSTAPVTSSKKEDDRREDPDRTSTTTQPTTTQPPTSSSSTRPGRPCGVLCPSDTSTPNDPDPVGNPPTR